MNDCELKYYISDHFKHVFLSANLLSMHQLATILKTRMSFLSSANNKQNPTVQSCQTFETDKWQNHKICHFNPCLIMPKQKPNQVGVTDIIFVWQPWRFKMETHSELHLNLHLIFKLYDESCLEFSCVLFTMHMSNNRHIFHTIQGYRNPCHCKNVAELQIFNDWLLNCNNPKTKTRLTSYLSLLGLMFCSFSSSWKQ